MNGTTPAQFTSIEHPVGAAGTHKRFAEFLAERYKLTEEQKEKIRSIPFDRIYEAAPICGIDEVEMAKVLAEYTRLPFMERVSDPDPGNGSALPLDFCKRNSVVPVMEKEGANLVAVSNPLDIPKLDTLRAAIGKESVGFVVCPPRAIADAIREMEGVRGDARTHNGHAPQISISLKAPSEGERVSFEEIAKKPVVAAANLIIAEGLKRRASDIHIEPKQGETQVRMRIDGMLRDVLKLSPDMATRVISRYKALAGMDIAERRAAQDGQLEVDVDGRRITLRLASMPTPYGEKMAIRIVDPDKHKGALEEMGFDKKQLETLKSLVQRDNGLLLFAGPTGSGKSSSVHALLTSIDFGKRQLITVEDPVEYNIPQANQVEVNEKAGLTFAKVLRNILRQDPDVIFVGEIRDEETAAIAVQAATTGRLVISTIHTANSTTAIFRLEQLGINRATLATAMTGVVAQRLVRKVCPHCKEVSPPTPRELELLGGFADKLRGVPVARGRGCDKCDGTGYLGRTGVYEVLPFDATIQRMIRDGVPVDEIRRHLARNGFMLIRDHCLSKVMRHITTIEEFHRTMMIDASLEDVEAETRGGGEPSGEEQPGAEGGEPRGGQVPERTRSIEDTSARGEAPTPQPDASRWTILVVEDDRVTRRLIASTLQKAGYRVVEADDGASALMALGKGNVDLVISDINMPNLDGFTLCELMKKKDLAVPIIFLTGSGKSDDELKGLELGAVDYLTKPFDRRILVARVKKALMVCKGATR